MRRIAILGSTGSIGVNTLRVVARHPERYTVGVLAAGRNVALLAEQVQQFRPQIVIVGDAERVDALRRMLNEPVPTIVAGVEGLSMAASDPEVDVVVAAMSGSAGLLPLLAAIDAGKRIALANKEALVMAGALVMERVRQRGTTLVPIDSEHSAVFQILQHAGSDGAARVYLTGSGGPLRERTAEALASASREEVLDHPRWKMGPKITVDSATLMNKGLELIEAHWLFGLPLERIEVVIHPEAVVHGLVEFVDGSLMAQLGPCDMQLPIQYALSYPDRWEAPAGRQVRPYDLNGCRFEQPDLERFPCLALAQRAVRVGGTLPAVLNAANELAVHAFLGGVLPFGMIPECIAAVMADGHAAEPTSLNSILGADVQARRTAVDWIARNTGTDALSLAAGIERATFTACGPTYRNGRQ